MIAQVNTPARRMRFLNACRGVPALGVSMPLELELFGKSMPGRFYAGPTLAIALDGNTASIAGHANPDELAGFLEFCGCGGALLDEAVCPPPSGWVRTQTLAVYGLAPGAALQPPPVDTALWAALTLDREPAASVVADFLFGKQHTTKRDDFYSQLCTKRTRGKALVWALKQENNIVCTVGAYAMYGGQGYMACGETAEPLRGRGVGGCLIVKMANELAAAGVRPVFLCGPERVHFYTRLGFDKMGELAQYEQKRSGDVRACITKKEIMDLC